ncbi:MAG: type II secretion system protein [Candidatus Taylorbacteria bacterium]
MKIRPFFDRAFTLIELMVVVAIIALLTGIIMTNLMQSKSKSRDTQRISDISQIQVALGLYFDRCNQFPSSLAIAENNGNSSGGVCTAGITLGSYISKIPSPPSSGETYGYGLNGENTDYVLHTSLENANPSATANGLSGTIYSQTCSNLANSQDYCVGPK